MIRCNTFCGGRAQLPFLQVSSVRSINNINNNNFRHIIPKAGAQVYKGKRHKDAEGDCRLRTRFRVTFLFPFF